MKALIVDDERIARQELRRLLAAHPEIEIAGEARGGEEALALIPKLAPDLVFLDIQMPGMTGFDLLERLGDLPQIIFTTAYDEIRHQGVRSKCTRLSLEAHRSGAPRRSSSEGAP